MRRARFQPGPIREAGHDSDGTDMTASGTPAGDATDEIVEEAGRQLRAPAAAGIAGLLFAILFTTGLVLLRHEAIYIADDAELARLYARGDDLRIVIGGLYLAPFAGIMFLWFIAVIRDQVGELRGPVLRHGLLRQRRPVRRPAVRRRRRSRRRPASATGTSTSRRPARPTIDLLRSLSYTTTFAFENRAAGVFLFATATIGLKTGAFPRWFSILSYVLGAILLLAVSFVDWAILVLPAWVAVVSVFILLRERARSRAA